MRKQFKIAKVYKEFDRIITALSRKLADKNETKKIFKQLEVQYKKMYEVYMTLTSPEHEEAMFLKKYLGIICYYFIF